MIHDRFLAPDAYDGPPLTMVTDGASLLWRLAVRGVPPHTLPFEVTAERIAATFPNPGLAFLDLHATMAASAAGRGEDVERRIAALEALAAEGRLLAGPAVPALCRGIAAFAAGAWDEAADRLVPLLPEVVRIGGSGAQRDVVEETAIAACLRAGRGEQAARILRRRHRLPPA